MYSGHSGEDLILTWSVSPLDSQRHSLLSWSHEWIHWRDSKASSWGKKKKKHHLYQGQKRWGALEKHKWRATQRYCFRQDDGRWEIQRTDLNLGSGILLDLWHASLMSQMVKTLPAMLETRVQSLDKGMATHSSILAWRMPWTEEPRRLQSLGSQRVRHSLATKQQPPPPLPLWTACLVHQSQTIHM